MSLAQYAAILLASVLGSFGAAGLPLQVLGLLLAIDRVLDMMRTMTNVTGQVLVPVLVVRETGFLDRAVFAAAVDKTALASGVDQSEEAR